jgi:hypothetical protein
MLGDACCVEGTAAAPCSVRQPALSYRIDLPGTSVIYKLQGRFENLADTKETPPHYARHETFTGDIRHVPYISHHCAITVLLCITRRAPTLSVGPRNEFLRTEIDGCCG